MSTQDLRILVHLGQAGVRTNDPALARRVLRVLRQFLAISNGTTSHMVDITSTTGDPAKPPPRADSPFDVYIAAFRKATARGPNDARLEGWVRKAEAELANSHDDREQIASSFRAASEWDVDGAAAEEQQAEFVIQMYRGDSPAHAARLEGDHRLEPWIRKVRRRHRCDEETGNPITQWERWSETERREQVRNLRRRNPMITVRAAADHFQVSKSTIHERYWGELTNPNRKAA